MRYEVVEEIGEWVVFREGCELARYPDQDQALNDVAGRLRVSGAANASTAASLSVRYKTRIA